MVTTFSVQDVPFSHPGAWFGISPVVAEKTYADDLHLVSHQTGMHAVLRFVPTRGGGRVDARVTATPARLEWAHGAGAVEVVFENADTVRLRGRGLGMRVAAAAAALTPFSGAYLYGDPRDGSYVFTSYETGRRYRVTVLPGSRGTAAGAELLGSGDRHLDLPDDCPWEVAIEEYATGRDPYRPDATFDQLADAARSGFDRYLDAVAPWRSTRTPAAELAVYVLWSATVAPAGFLTRPAVLMSKHWMDKVWSWDHCFNALALAAGDPDLAWHQFHVPFDHQDPTGALPDSVAHSEVLYNFVKPPLHGWAFARLRRLLPAPPAQDRLAEVYQRLGRWTEFWLTQRRAPGHVLAHYHHGNDSGWDNATTFDAGGVLETADLATALIMQLRELGRLAAELGHTAAAVRWTDTAEQMQATLLSTLWDGSRFRARNTHTGQLTDSTSLLALMPIALGSELPDEVRIALTANLKAHLTPHGLATEPPGSPHYLADGYWRGPIWAPPTLLVEDRLRRAGQRRLADDISDRFRRLCETSGFAENFNAETGEGLRDRAYTWTAAGYLILAAAHEARTSTSMNIA
ncbi:trehalase family glycosidase [Actinoplanes sp. KI2]|uniref:amylo-alpha-1,6-glucosidase n=1 Tax=Actinoplanes sp. KI2 TaxID=2983315 RepID=UPI0021D5BE37|nr:trehalase family glycosidase [Actinoplanes sp. KI2]MCU7730074.1 trehalase family glycosidase [Actinoplanes sp. KI2]